MYSQFDVSKHGDGNESPSKDPSHFHINRLNALDSRRCKSNMFTSDDDNK